MSITHGDRVAQGTRRHRVKVASIPQELDRVQMGPFDKVLIGVQVHKAQGHAAMLAVPQDQQGKLTALTNVLQQLQEQNMMGRVSSIDLTHTSYMLLRLDGSIDAKLPLTGDTAYYLRALNAAVEEENRRRGGQAVGTMDLTQKEYTAIFTPAEGS